jgi:uncharacterized protein YndB with AHSA1/START domain
MIFTGSSTDRIHKDILLRADHQRIWQALVDQRQFGAWFGVDLPEGVFEPGAEVAGQITSPGYEHLTMRLLVEEVVPPRRLSFRWHPDAVTPGVDFDQEPTTLVTFELHDATDGILLTLDETGFDQLPVERRAAAYRGNEGGWTEQMTNIARYVGAND